jgi:hypothetical protein
MRCKNLLVERKIFATNLVLENKEYWSEADTQICPGLLREPLKITFCLLSSTQTE